MKLVQKLLEIQKSVDKIVKDGKNLSDKYDFASDEAVLDRFRPLMDEQNLLLIPEITNASVMEGTTRSGTARYLTELHMTMTWVDTDTGETLTIPWYAQGVDLAGEKGVGKALTYAEKMHLLKLFHVATSKDDPDNDNRTKSGELRQKGTAAAKETTQFQRAAVAAMLDELYSGDAEKIKAAYIALTKNEKRGYAGVDNLAGVTDAALPVVYSKLCKTYEQRMGHKFEMKEASTDAND